MSSQFAFQAFGLSQAVTVGGAAPATLSLTVLNNTTVTQTTLGGNFQPDGVRIVNNGTASVFMNFYPSTTVSITVSATNAMQMLSNTVETFRVRGQPVIAFACTGTNTVTLSVTPGEGV